MFGSRGKLNQIKIIDGNPKLKSQLDVEIQVMRQVKHPNVMRIYEYMASDNSYYIVMQYCNKGDLQHVLSKLPRRYLDESEALYFLKQLMNGFQALRKENIMHRDLKLENIFLHDETLIIGDFGLAKAGAEMAQTILGTPLTMAPEVLKEDEVTIIFKEAIHL